MHTLYVGATIKLTARIWSNQARVDPTEVVLKIKEPDGTVVTIAPTSLTKTVVGTYHYNFTPSKAGIHTYQWSTTSPNGVRASNFEAVARPIP